MWQISVNGIGYTDKVTYQRLAYQRVSRIRLRPWRAVRRDSVSLIAYLSSMIRGCMFGFSDQSGRPDHGLNEQFGN